MFSLASTHRLNFKTAWRTILKPSDSPSETVTWKCLNCFLGHLVILENDPIPSHPKALSSQTKIFSC